MLEECVF